MKIFEKFKNRNRRDEDIELIERNPLNRIRQVNPTSSRDLLTRNHGYAGRNPFFGRVNLFDARDNEKLLRQLPFANVMTIPFQTQLSKHSLLVLIYDSQSMNHIIVWF